MGEKIRVRCDGCRTEISVTITGARRMSAVQRAARIDAELSATGWISAGLTDFCPDCTVEAPPAAGARPHLSIVRD